MRFRGWTPVSFTRPTGHIKDQRVSFCLLDRSDHWQQTTAGSEGFEQSLPQFNLP